MFKSSYKLPQIIQNYLTSKLFNGLCCCESYKKKKFTDLHTAVPLASTPITSRPNVATRII